MRRPQGRYGNPALSQIPETGSLIRFADFTTGLLHAFGVRKDAGVGAGCTFYPPPYRSREP